MARAKQWVAALPMYNVSPALRADWRTLIERVAFHLARGTSPAIMTVEEPGAGAQALHAFWRRDDLLLSQTCGYPLIHGLFRDVQLIGAPRFSVPGCQGSHYSSTILVRAADGPATLADCRGARAACNDRASHSGMNALRHAVAPLAGQGRFFDRVVYTGAHLQSMAAVADGEADVAAIDCVTLAFAREHAPSLVAKLRQIGSTRAVAGLPFIASRRASPTLVRKVGDALRAVLGEDAALRGRLRLDDIVPCGVADYLPHAEMAYEARRHGYGELA